MNTPVRRVRWGGRVEVETDRGSITAGSCIVTVSTGVLAAGVIAFDPKLPPRVEEFINALPMGLAMKVALRATGPDRLDLPMHCSVDRRVERSGDPLMPFQCWPHRPGLRAGLDRGIARPGTCRSRRDGRRGLRAERAAHAFSAAGSTGCFPAVPRWSRIGTPIRWIRGAYAYAVPGSADARARLGEPLADGHLLFAGEACNTPYAGTLGGAWLSGQAAAKAAA